MICKDCIHYDVCNSVIKINYLVPADELCLEFKNKVDYVEVKHGYWIDKPIGRYCHIGSYCSICQEKSGIGSIKSNRHKPYCPNCGAKMDGEEEISVGTGDIPIL